MGVNGNGRRELLASKVGDSETETSWRKSSAHLKHPREPGLNGVRLVFSDAHTGLTKAIRRQLQGCVCQRCRAHCARNLLQRAPKAHHGMVTAAVGSVVAQESAEEIESRWKGLAASLAERFAKAPGPMHEAQVNMLAWTLPRRRWHDDAEMG